MNTIARALVLASLNPAAALAEQPRIPVDCRHALDRVLSGWSVPRPSDEEQEWSNSENLDPAVAVGDFDGDGRRDVAVLAQHDGLRKVALCLRSGRGYRVLVIDEPYCSDVIFATPAGTRVDDLEREAQFKLRHDGVSTYCVGKAGATYVIDAGRIRRIVDSD